MGGRKDGTGRIGRWLGFIKSIRESDGRSRVVSYFGQTWISDLVISLEIMSII
jgi:hypothetical protein